jgi:hypothetical protein
MASIPEMKDMLILDVFMKQNKKVLCGDGA